MSLAHTSRVTGHFVSWRLIHGKAYRLKLEPDRGFAVVVPVSRSAAEQIKALRQMASGKFISASMPGVYRYEEESTAVGRRMIRRNEPLTILAPPRSEA